MVAKKVTKKPAAKAKKPTEAEKLASIVRASIIEQQSGELTPFDPKSPDGKIYLRVAKDVLKQHKPKAAPKPKPAPVTDAMFMKWFLKQSATDFLLMVKEWNEANLKIKIPKHENYDEWLNYFKRLTPTVIQKLAKTGVDFLPTEAYAALSRWHEIIKSPHRIDKIHQAGLNYGTEAEKETSILALSQSNDRLGVLKASRDKIAMKLDKGAGNRDTALLLREMGDIMEQIAAIEKRQGPKKTTRVGALMAEVDLRKRPSANGGGARNTSYKSKIARVTIDDLEG
jgi:hypothetical protein